MHDYLCSVTLGLLYNCIFGGYFYWVFVFVFSRACQEIDWEEHDRNDLFCVEWDI